MLLSTVDQETVCSPPSKVVSRQLAEASFFPNPFNFEAVSQRRTRSALPGVGVELMANLHDTLSERIHGDVARPWFRFRINYNALNIYYPRNEYIHAGRCVSRLELDLNYPANNQPRESMRRHRFQGRKDKEEARGNK